MASYENEKAIERIIENLNSIPKKIESKIFINEIEERLMEKLRRKIVM